MTRELPHAVRDAIAAHSSLESDASLHVALAETGWALVPAGLVADPEPLATVVDRLTAARAVDQSPSGWTKTALTDAEKNLTGREALEALTADVLALADELDAAWQREHDRRYDPNRLQYAEGACDALDDAEQRLRRLVARHGQEARDGS